MKLPLETDRQELHSFISKDDERTEFTISSILYDNGKVLYEVICVKNGEDVHWCLYFADKELATKEFNRWGGAYVP